MKLQILQFIQNSDENLIDDQYKTAQPFPISFLSPRVIDDGAGNVHGFASPGQIYA